MFLLEFPCFFFFLRKKAVYLRSNFGNSAIFFLLIFSFKFRFIWSLKESLLTAKSRCLHNFNSLGKKCLKVSVSYFVYRYRYRYHILICHGHGPSHFMGHGLKFFFTVSCYTNVLFFRVVHHDAIFNHFLRDSPYFFTIYLV